MKKYYFTYRGGTQLLENVLKSCNLLYDVEIHPFVCREYFREIVIYATRSSLRIKFYILCV